MAKVLIEVDTDTGLLSVKVGEAVVPNVSWVSANKRENEVTCSIDAEVEVAKDVYTRMTWYVEKSKEAEAISSVAHIDKSLPGFVGVSNKDRLDLAISNYLQ